MTGSQHIPEVLITPDALRKLNLYINALDEEISGMGKVVPTTLGNLLITGVRIYKQDVSGGHTALDREKLNDWFMELIEKEGPEEATNSWRLWWHSHAKMGTFFSSVDDANMDGWDNWMLGHVGNHRGDHRFRLDYYHPRLTIDPVEWRVFDVPTKKEEEEVEAEVKRLVTVEKKWAHGGYTVRFVGGKREVLKDGKWVQEDYSPKDSGATTKGHGDTSSKRGNPRNPKLPRASTESHGEENTYHGLPMSIYRKRLEDMTEEEHRIYDDWFERRYDEHKNDLTEADIAEMVKLPQFANEEDGGGDT